MTKLISDYAKVEISNKVKDILRMYHSSSWNSEPYHQNQNPAEGRYCTLKSWTNTIMNITGAPADCWLLCMIHASYILKSPLLRGVGWKCSSRYALWCFSRHQHPSTLHILPTKGISYHLRPFRLPGKDISHPVGALRINISRRGVTRFTSKPRFSGY